MPWITITSGAAGDGNGAVAFSVAANTAGARVGSLTIAGFAVTVSQSGGCSYVVTPATLAASPAGGSAGPISVTTATGCSWAASSNASWITFPSGSSGSGSGSLTLSVAAGLPTARTGNVTIEGHTVTVTQPGVCSYSINPTSMVVDRKRETSSVAVSAPAGCGWTTVPVSIGPWIEVNSGSGSGNGTVSFTVDPNNNGPSRTAILLIAGHTFTLTQESR